MNLFRLLLLLFILVPILEIYLLITVGSFIGAVPTILLLMLAAITGSYLLRTQGLITLQKMQTTLEQGQLPAEALLEGVLLLCGGALFLAPGFLTDIAALVCVFPGSRKYLVRKIIQHLQQTPTSSPPRSRRSPTTLEGEYRREDNSP
jgi:UPF0716 protein FxsA